MICCTTHLLKNMSKVRIMYIILYIHIYILVEFKTIFRFSNTEEEIHT